MNPSQFQQEECLDEQFGYSYFYDSIPRAGWLLNYHIVHLEKQNDVILYFVDEKSVNFKVKLRYFPSCVLESSELQDTEEYILRKYEGEVHLIEHSSKIDTTDFNHLNRLPKRMLKIYFKHDIGFNRFLRDVKELLCERKSASAGYLQIHSASENAYDSIVNVFEFDISPDIQAGAFYNIRCGSWFDVSYDGNQYTLEKNAKVAYPDLRIMAYDIETTKQPLKFPKPGLDQVMMISIMTESFGELIINREVVSENIQEFEYSPKPEIKTAFRVFNEDNEEALLVRFVEVIQQACPHIITTYNGGYFDFDFIEKRLEHYGMSLQQLTGVSYSQEYYDCPFMIHLDCYKWVKRDSYLPMSCQGLKAATKAKLGYFPDEIDPEDMMRCAVEEPQKMASYSVSDAVATYLLYDKYVHPHIFSISSIIPMPPVQILCRGSGTLCEALLISQAFEYNVLVPTIKRDKGIQYYEGHVVENLTYVGGHVESLKAGVFRSDFQHNFDIDHQTVKMIVDNMDDMLSKYTECEDYRAKKEELVQQLLGNIGPSLQTGEIYHLDVGAMYPNIILTNRLQPISIVNEDVCVRCDFNDAQNQCKKPMNWISRAEYYPPSGNEVKTIRKRLQNEPFYVFVNNEEKKVSYDDLPSSRQNSILLDRITEYSKKIYSKTKKREEKLQEVTVCQREVPFYVETVRKFRDARYVYKDLYKKAAKEADLSPTKENKNKVVIYNSLQTAYKCILNSFYGYVMRRGSRWFSIEMAAVTCHTGGAIIKLARSLLDGIGMPLELDTDGIWAILPSSMPNNIAIGGNRISLLANILNYFVCKKFTNDQYQQKVGARSTPEFEISSQNSIYFEIDGPYRTMVIPSSTEENRLLKKRYVVFDHDGKITELKGFELKRRGELNLIKKFQEDIFEHFNDGSNLQECYDSLANVCNYWLDIIHSKGENMDENSIFYLFSESRSMSKDIGDYANKKSNILSTAKRLAEFLGDDILGDKLKCEFIISRFPEGEPTASRAIPVMIFKSVDCRQYLEKWLGRLVSYELKDILDWDYYKTRFEAILQRLVVIPAHFQHIPNPVPRVTIPKWTNKNSNLLKFKKIQTCDFEDFGKSDDLVLHKLHEGSLCDNVFRPLGSDEYSDAFFIKNKRVRTEEIAAISFQHPALEPAKEETASCVLARNASSLKDFLGSVRALWLGFYRSQSENTRKIAKIEYCRGQYCMVLFDGKREDHEFVMELFLDINDAKYFDSTDCVRLSLPNRGEAGNLFKLQLTVSEYEAYRKTRFFDHFAIKNIYNHLDPMYQILWKNDAVCTNQGYLVVTSFQYQKKPVYCVSNSKDKTNVFISELRIDGIDFHSLKSYKYPSSIKILLVNRFDHFFRSIKTFFDGSFCIELDLKASGLLQSFEGLKSHQIELHRLMIASFVERTEIARLAKIPIMNIDHNILDYYFYKTMMDSGVICIVSEDRNNIVVRDEVYRSGYYGTYVLQLEVCQSLLLSVIEYESFIQNPSFPGVHRCDFKVLREFLKMLLIKSVQGNVGATALLSSVEAWIKRDSRFVSAELRETVTILQQQYLLGLTQRLKDLQINVICLTKEILFIETEKKDALGCEEYTKYISKQVNSLEGYELLALSVLKTFEKVSFVDPCTYFYSQDGLFYESNCSSNIPASFFELYFSDLQIENDQVYDLVGKMDAAAAKLLLRILSYKRDIHGLASNCYKLLKTSGFTKVVEFKPNLTVFCQSCHFENFLRHTCVKCYSQIDSSLLEAECQKYLHYCWKQQINGDRYCSLCGKYEERKLKEYCGCGGKFVLKDYSEEIENMKVFVNTMKFDNEVDRVKAYFAS